MSASSEYPVLDESKSEYSYTMDDKEFIGYKPKFIDEKVIIDLPTFEGDILRTNVLNKISHANFDDSGNWREYIHYSVATNTARRQPICVALNIHLGLVGSTDGRSNKWKEDKAVGAENQLNDSYYSRRGWDKDNLWDKGHMARRYTAAWGKDKEARIRASDDTLYYTNCCLQHGNLNKDEWLQLEEEIQNEIPSNGKISVFSGPIYDFDVTIFAIDPDTKEKKGIIEFSDPDGEGGQKPAELPDAFFKIVSFVNQKGNLETRSYIYKQSLEIISNVNDKTSPSKFNSSIETIEGATGLLFPDILKKPFFVGPLESSGEDVDAAPIVDSNSPFNPAGIMAADNVFIAAAFINPAVTNEEEKESMKEWVSIANYSPNNIDLSGWTIDDQAGSRAPVELSGKLASGDTRRVSGGGNILLTNNGGSLTLKNADGVIVDSATWSKKPADGTVTIFDRK